MALRRRPFMVTALLGSVALIAVGLWLWREPIARDLIDSSLTDRNIPASYEIEHLGTKRQRLKNIRLGSADRPDLTADWAEIETGYSLSGVEVRTVRAGGVRLYGQYKGGKLTLGSVDRLLPAPDGTPFRLPDIDVMLSDARLSLKTDAGPVGIALTGKGMLSNGFVGQVALASQGLAQGLCKAGSIRASGKVSVVDRAPSFEGPVSVARVNCDNVVVDTLLSRLNLKADSSLEKITLASTMTTRAIKAGSIRSGSSQTRFSFDSRGNRFNNLFDISLASLETPAGRAETANFKGSSTSSNMSGLVFTGSGLASASGFVPAPQIVSKIRSLDNGGGTPVEPLLMALQRAVAGLGKGSDMNARVRFEKIFESIVRVDAISARSKSGAKLEMPGKEVARYSWPDGKMLLNGTAQLSGGGFPQLAVKVKGSPGTLAGVATMAPWQQDGARLTFSPANFAYRNGGLSLDTIARIDGPIGAGRIAGLTVPVSLRPGRDALAGCFTPRFDRLQIDTLQLNNAQIRACIANGAATLPALRLAGRLGDTPLTLAAKGARIGFSKGDFSATGVAIRLDQGEKESQLDAGRIWGSFANGGAAGRFEALSGKVQAVPLLLDEGQGRWTLKGGDLSTTAQIRISDAAPDFRFRPLVSPDFNLTLRNGLIKGEGTLRNAPRDVDVARVFLDHRLSNGTGQAVIDMAGITFGQRVQPEELTPITLGVIANVEGTLKGQGLINWRPDGVTSSGSFGTDGMNMAAAFGPVTGLSGQIQFSDLLGMETAAGQQVRIANINPGIAVLDGLISYRLLPGLKAQIEGGTWPFAGGTLTLEPTILDLNQSAERRLTFKVQGADAAKFIAAMEFENIVATGTFDGELPMVFDDKGGNIVGGFLVARAGGTLSYIGRISDQNVGSLGRFAFDALKSIRYSRLRIDLDGAIDGDVITKISFAGLNQAPIEGVRASFPIPIKITGLDNIPFIFNITITAKFRRLFEMARGFNDPSLLINRMIPSLEPVPDAKPKPVQPPERPPSL